MAVDLRTPQEKKKKYPPSPGVMVDRCTTAICGAPNEWLFDLITANLLAYLNAASLTANKLFEDFGDTAGSFGAPEVDVRPSGDWLSWSHVGWLDKTTASRLANCSPSNWLDVLRVPNVGPDTFYDMFRRVLIRRIGEFGECLGTFRWPDGRAVDAQYFWIKQTGVAKEYWVKTNHGLPIDVETGSMFVFPALGEYTIKTAHPDVDFMNPGTLYQPAELKLGASFQTKVQVTVASRFLEIGVLANGVTIDLDPRFTKISLVMQKTDYWAWATSSDLVNKRFQQCTNTTCKSFAFRRQEEIEDAPVRSTLLPRDMSRATFLDLQNGRYKVLGYSDKDIVVATVIDIHVGTNGFCFHHLTHTYDFSRKDDPLPRKAFLQGDIIRQSQRSTSNCGTFSIALAASYWRPFDYNPLERNGKWVEDKHGSWLPGTFQGKMEDVARALGFSNNGTSLSGSLSRNEALARLKMWIACGVPVIVNIDEYQDTALTKGEHYKVLIGYDDDAVLHYTRDDGTVGTNHGALYFINPGAKGLAEGNPEDLESVKDVADLRRENHDDYNRVPIGNDVDAYNVFWKKWNEGGIPLLTDDRWYMPLYPLKG